MKNVLIVLPNDVLGGAEQYLRMIAESFYRQGYVAHIFFLKKIKTHAWEKLKNENFRLYYTMANRERYSLFYLIINLLKVKKVHFEYAFTSHVHCSSLIGILRKFTLLKINCFVARESTSVFQRFSGSKLFRYKILYRLGYSSVDLLICQTDFMRKQLIEGLPWIEQKSKVKTIPNPINLLNISEQAQEKLDWKIQEPYIVSAGRLIPEKGFDILIKAFSRLKFTYNDLKLIILGDGKLRSEIENLIKELHLEDDVILYGFADNVYPFFKNAVMCAVSSRIEGFPNVLLQMMSQNEKVVSTLCAGEIEKIAGLFTCQTENESALAITINNCLQANTEECRKMFDKELKKRSIDEFISQVNIYLSETD
jgi:glycosyltransferase involved in cell wall biosynthesis